MREWVNFVFNKTDTKGLKFHYLRVGKASPLFDSLAETTQDLEITWIQQETKKFRDHFFPSTYSDFAAAVVNLHLDEDEIGEIRKDFWESYIWKTEDAPIPVAIVIPNTGKYGSLTIAEVIEVLSLIRLTDRAFEIFESTENVAEDVMSWLINISSHIHRNEPEEIEEEEKISS